MKVLLFVTALLFMGCMEEENCVYQFTVTGLDGRERGVFTEDTVYIGTIAGAQDQDFCSSSRKVLVETRYHRYPYVESYVEDGGYYHLTTGNVLERY